jgi:hypothetical protein
VGREVEVRFAHSVEMVKRKKKKKEKKKKMGVEGKRRITFKQTQFSRAKVSVTLYIYNI